MYKKRGGYVVRMLVIKLYSFFVVKVLDACSTTLLDIVCWEASVNPRG